MNSPEDKREHPRIELILKITYASGKDFLSDFTSNASSGGVFIATKKSFALGETLNFSISFPGLLDAIECRGHVRWRRTEEQATDDLQAGIGVAFDFESEEEAEKIRSLVTRLTGNEGGVPGRDTAPEHPAAPFRVLLVEDNKVVRDMVAFALKKFHWSQMAQQRPLELVEASNGQEAWELVQQSPFDLAVVDMYMPVMDGKDLIARIRKGPHAPEMPIIAISAGGEDARDTAHAAGADFFLGKPVMLAQLFHSLHRLLGLESDGA